MRLRPLASLRSGAQSFRYPQPAELAQSVLAELGPQPGMNAATRAAARIRTSGRWFTWSALVPVAAGILFGIGLGAVAKYLPDPVFWPVVATLCVLIVATELSWRTLIAAQSPVIATLYYAAACMNCLRSVEISHGDVQYLSMVLPHLEDQLTASRLNRQAAGTRVARGHVAAVQAGLARRVGEAERTWRQDQSVATTEALRESIARAAVVVALDAWFTSPTTATTYDQPVSLARPGHVPFLSRIFEAAMTKSTELSMGAAGSALMLLFASAGR